MLPARPGQERVLVTVRFGHPFRAAEAEAGFCLAGTCWQIGSIDCIPWPPRSRLPTATGPRRRYPVDGSIRSGTGTPTHALQRPLECLLSKGLIGGCRSCRWGTQQVQRYIGLVALDPAVMRYRRDVEGLPGEQIQPLTGFVQHHPVT